MNEMYKRIMALRANYKSKVEEMEALNDKSNIEKRDLSDEELKRFDELESEAQKLNSEAQRLESIYAHKTGVSLRDHNAGVNRELNESSHDRNLGVELNRSFSEWVATGDKNKENEYRSLTKEFEQVRATTQRHA